MKHELLNGETLDLSEISREDMEFLLALMRRAMQDEDYFSLERAVCGPGAYPLKGSARVTREIHDSLLFRVAEDTVDRAGIRQGVIAPDPGDERVPTEDIVSVTEAARHLGVTRSAVIKAAQAGRLKGKKIGHTWALLRRSVESYRVAQHRVEAGRAAHRA
jgi:excisionase family DNA binding protein